MTAAGIDPAGYFPQNGDLAYDVLRYDLRLSYGVEGNQLRARAVLDVVANADLRVMRLDLAGLRVTKVQVEGAAHVTYAARRNHLVLRFAKAVRAGRELRLTIAYQGSPTPIGQGSDEMGWEELADGVLVAGQTNGAPSWFPCNDRPSNKASYRFEITVASAYHTVANGVLTSRRRGASTTTWVYEQDEPMATYLATLQIGRYSTHRVPASRVPMTAVLPDSLIPKYDSAFGRQPEMLAFFERTYGPYPFPAYTVVVTADRLDIPLEAQGMSVFGANFLTGCWDNVRLVAHELSHQWFGNSLTLADWRDIWLHEGFACYSEWLWSEESGGRSADVRAREHWNRLAGKPQGLLLGDPGPEDMFDDRVYKRGALLLHALRLTVGDEKFFALLKNWVSSNAHGSVTTAMFVELAEQVCARPLQDLFSRWLSKRPLPQLPAAPKAAPGSSTPGSSAPDLAARGSIADGSVPEAPAPVTPAAGGSTGEGATAAGPPDETVRDATAPVLGPGLRRAALTTPPAPTR